ncbi:phenylalanine--tRNA ligase subunit beta [Solilutibacter silvestris]|uniref:Phenylalanine--tRNA ligase beta subunit n=1 Tax=Solilutibacter silvestris TaxID=1645665 RepID=A0A2K1PXX3_9GAMM|nr:phenylalanine--tRNA ligase subunit beta [Lysobacter silvestris]PNS07642.1 phenylalanine--tRNA ligase, beta subunit [Lysobacter silvestris]
MKFSELWLRELVPTTQTREQLEATLTAIGLEVEDSDVLGQGLGNDVVVAQIRDCARHPEADRLQVCTVDAGVHGVLQIVCGAPNARSGLKAPLALVGAKIGEITIKPAKLRGVESNGMLCSAKELGIDADASGLLELPADAPVGMAIGDYLGLPDAVIELGLTPNRADCFCLSGIARDVAAATGTALVEQKIDAVPAQSTATLPITLDAGADAPRYVGRVIEGIDAKVATPLWMAERLRRSGIRPVSFLVDVTQYVMLELGQPMHAFDRDRLQGPIGVRRARAGETLKLLDGREVAVDDGFLVITDADRAVALAGVMGGFDTRVGDGTRNVFLEAAHFAPAAIIGRSRKLGMHTDASHRFERGVDPQLPRVAIERATALILEVAGGTPGPVSEVALDAELPRPQPVSLRRARLARVLGVTIADADVERILRSLGFAVNATADGWMATAPSSRFDIAIEEDLIEEVARIHGYDAIPTTLPAGGATVRAPSETRVSDWALRRQLVARGYLEAITFAFVDARQLQAWQMTADSLELANPLSAELAVMRTSLVPGLAEALARNSARQQSRVRLFELGNVFHATNDAPLHTQRIAVIACGSAADEQWGDANGKRGVDVFDLKGDLDTLAALADATLDYRAARLPWAHPGRCANVFRGDVKLGWIAELHPALCNALDLPARTCAFEVDLAPLALRDVPKSRPLSRFPSVRRDLALVVPRNIEWEALARSVRESAGEWLRELVLFDVYTGPGVGDDEKSFAMGLILQEESRTLTDQDVNALITKVIDTAASRHGAVVRG